MANEYRSMPDASLIAILSVPKSRSQQKISTLSLLYQDRSYDTKCAIFPSVDDSERFFPGFIQPVNEDLLSFVHSSDISLFALNAGASVATSSYLHSSVLTTTAYNSRSRILAGGTHERFIALWRVDASETNSSSILVSPVGELYDRPMGRVNGLCFAGDDRLVSASSTGFAHVWDVSKQTLVGRLQVGQWNEQVEGIDVSSDGGTFVAGVGQVLVYCDPRRSPREDFHVLLDGDDYVEDLFWVKSREHLFVVEASGSLLVFDDREPADPVVEWENTGPNREGGGGYHRRIAELDGECFVAISDDSVCSVWTYGGQKAWEERENDRLFLGLCCCSSGLRREDLRKVEERLVFICSTTRYFDPFRICIGATLSRILVGFSCLVK